MAYSEPTPRIRAPKVAVMGVYSRPVKYMIPPAHPITMNMVTTGVRALSQSRYITSKPANTNISPVRVIATRPEVSDHITVVNTTEFPVIVTSTPGGGDIHAISSRTISVNSLTPVKPISLMAFPMPKSSSSIFLP